MSADRIVRIELTPLFVPFRAEVIQAMQSGAGGLGMAIAAEQPWAGGDFVVAKLVTEGGHVGLGEAFVWLPETGVSPAQIIDSVQHGLAAFVLGERPFDVERMRRRMDDNIARNEVAKGLLDMACYDLMGRMTGLPACDFMGGRSVSEVPLAALIPLTDVEVMVGLCQHFYADGVRTFRLKLGVGVTRDREIVERVRKELGDDVRLRVDYNQAYSAGDAVRAIRAIEPFGIDFAEQPVCATDPLAMAWVQQRVDTALMAHEGCFSLQDIVTLIELRAVGVVGINSERPGGVTNALRAIGYAEQRGFGVVLHNQPLGIASAMHVHLAAAKHHSLGHATELFGYAMLEDDLLVERLDYSGGTVRLPEGPGWGVTLDEDALGRYATGPTVTVQAE